MVAVSPARAKITSLAVNVNRAIPRRLRAALTTWKATPSMTAPVAHTTPDHWPMKKWATMPSTPATKTRNCQRASRSLQIGRSSTMGMS
jgi:hypothetical protein